VELVEGVHKLAVLRANAIGDYLVSLPAIQALRIAYPAAELVLLGADWHAGFLAGRPGPVDRCLPVPPTVGGARRPADSSARRGRPLLRPHAGRAVRPGRAATRRRPPFQPVPAPARGRVTAGSRTPNAQPLDRTVPYTGHQHEIHRSLRWPAWWGRPR